MLQRPGAATEGHLQVGQAPLQLPTRVGKLRHGRDVARGARQDALCVAAQLQRRQQACGSENTCPVIRLQLPDAIVEKQVM